MKRLIKLLAVITLFLTACVISDCRPYKKPLYLHYVDQFSQEEQGQIRNAITFYTESWESVNGQRVPNSDVYIHRGRSMVNQGREVIGYYSPADDEIHLVAGNHMEVPATFHEYCHAAFAKYDVLHTHPFWPRWRYINDSLVGVWRANQGR